MVREGFFFSHYVFLLGSYGLVEVAILREEKRDKERQEDKGWE